jgi:hypothetical protein
MSRDYVNTYEHLIGGSQIVEPAKQHVRGLIRKICYNKVLTGLDDKCRYLVAASSADVHPYGSQATEATRASRAPSHAKSAPRRRALRDKQHRAVLVTWSLQGIGAAVWIRHTSQPDFQQPVTWASYRMAVGPTGGRPDLGQRASREVSC